MLKLLLLFIGWTQITYAQSTLEQVVKNKPLPPTWDQLIIFKKEWKVQGLVVVKHGKIKRIDTSGTYRTSLAFSSQSVQLRFPWLDSTAQMKIEYDLDHQYYLMTDQVIGPYGYYQNLSYKIYAVDSSFLLVEPVDYFDFLKKTNRKQPGSGVPGPIYVGAGRIDINLGGSKRTLWVYRAVH
jgi:hypothetical protein